MTNDHGAQKAPALIDSGDEAGSLGRDASLAETGIRQSDRVAAAILDTIIQRRLKPGSRLPTERALADQFSVSRTVVREAVRGLAMRGILSAWPGRGLRVETVDAAAVAQSVLLFVHGRDDLDYEKVHEVREKLELETATLAAARATDDETRALQSVLDRAELNVEDLSIGRSADADFHRLVARATHNELWELLIGAIAAPLAEIRRIHTYMPGRNAEVIAEHRAILNRIAVHDPEGARAAMRRHLESTLTLWKTQVEARERPQPPRDPRDA